MNQIDYQLLLDNVIIDPRYIQNIEFGEPRSGHPEGKIKHHIADLEANLEQFRPRLQNTDEYWKLKFLIHVHDTFKAEVQNKQVARAAGRSHEALARLFASEFTTDADLLNMIEYHDANYTLWKHFRSTGQLERALFQTVLDAIQDWDLFLIFTIVDGHTPGKDLAKLPWFINQVRAYKQTRVDESWTRLPFRSDAEAAGS